MNDQALKAFIAGALASGCGALNQLIMAQIVRWKEEDNEPISAKTKRRLSLLLALITPSVLYGFVVFMGWETYGIAAHIAYVGIAFMTAQAVHGEMRLPSGAQERVQERLDAYVGKLPRGDDPDARIRIDRGPTDLSNSGDAMPYPDGERGPSGGL
jgi:hypothetical protein